MTFSDKVIPRLASVAHFAVWHDFLRESHTAFSSNPHAILGMTLLSNVIPNFSLTLSQDFGMSFLDKVIPTFNTSYVLTE